MFIDAYFSIKSLAHLDPAVGDRHGPVHVEHGDRHVIPRIPVIVPKQKKHIGFVITIKALMVRTIKERKKAASLIN